MLSYSIIALLALLWRYSSFISSRLILCCYYFLKSFSSKLVNIALVADCWKNFYHAVKWLIRGMNLRHESYSAFFFQFSIFNPGIRPKWFSLFVTNIISFSIATPAIKRSMSSSVFPDCRSIE
jgi:hypothetical protein